MDMTVEVKNLNVVFKDQKVLTDINLSIEKNSFTAIVGPNGAGKSTFLKVLLGIQQPTTGTIRINNKKINQIPAESIGYVPQVKTMDRSFPAMSIELVMSGISSRWPWQMEKKVKDKAISALEKVGAANLARKPLSKLSGGELQRVCLARSIVREPELIMLDEPTTGIDVVGERDLYRLLEEYQKSSGATIIMITHDWHAATHHANFVLLLNQKQISFGPPAEALTEDNLRIAFGHVGHEHALKLFANSHD